MVNDSTNQKIRFLEMPLRFKVVTASAAREAGGLGFEDKVNFIKSLCRSKFSYLCAPKTIGFWILDFAEWNDRQVAGLFL